MEPALKLSSVGGKDESCDALLGSTAGCSFLLRARRKFNSGMVRWCSLLMGVLLCVSRMMASFSGWVSQVAKWNGS
jgi:ABC-type sulfate transport system permease subunit